MNEFALSGSASGVCSLAVVSQPLANKRAWKTYTDLAMTNVYDINISI